MPHPFEHSDVRRSLDAAEAEAMAEAMRAFATASRLRLMWAMLDGEQPVERLAELCDASQSSVSHQLRILRQARLVTVRRDGRYAYYRLHDHHVPDVLAAIRHHQEHVGLPPLTAASTAEPSSLRAAEPPLASQWAEIRPDEGDSQPVPRRG